MAVSMVKLLRDLADAYEREEKGENDATLRSEIDELKAAVAARPAAEKRDALDDLDADERALIEQHRAGRATPPPEPEQIEPEVEEITPRKTRPGRKSGEIYEYTVDEDGRVRRVDIPTVYSGADEPDEVELPDEQEAAA
jgi:hypothetical protein